MTELLKRYQKKYNIEYEFAGIRKNIEELFSDKQETNCSIKSVKSRIFAENALKRIEKEISWKRIIYN